MTRAAGAASPACASAAFIRPRFFAGQLLTEDDLEALVDYVVARQRFHNTHLFGTGVVCGLAVECGPCDSSQVVIGAGHAIDGCGNDLVLGCARTLDLAPMIRELQARQRGGIDCTDPCPPPASQPAKPHRHYALYARYTERPDQPVAAYPVGDDCDAGAPSCEPTRILEGIGFELRCPPPAAAAATLADRLAACAGAPDGSASLVDRAIVYARYQRQLSRALARSTDWLDAEDLANLRDAARDLDSLLAGLTAAERLAASGQYVALIGPVIARVVRDKLAAPPDIDIEAILQNVTRAADAIALADPALIPLASERTLVVEAARLWNEAIAQSAEPEPGATSAAASPALHSYLAGAVVTPAVLAALTDELVGLAAELQATAGCNHEIHADCALRDLIDNLAPRWQLSDPARQLGQLGTMTAQLASIADAIGRLATDCRCAAINPPCATPGDTAVLLATIEVDRCNVVRICNTSRSYVLAPSTLRYWDAIELPDRTGCCGPEAAGTPGTARPPRTAGADDKIADKLAQLAAVRGRHTPSLRTLLPSSPDEPELDPAAVVNELVELRRSHAALERRLADLERLARLPADRKVTP
jgi:hypothetical protein